MPSFERAGKRPKMDVKTLCLGVLTLGEASGYEIKKQFAPADSFFSTPPTGTAPMVEGASPRLDDVLFALRLNEVSEPVSIGNSWTVGQPIRIIPESVQPLEEVRGKIIATIVDRRQEEELAKALAEARKEYPISINQSALAKVRPRKPR